MSTNYVNNLPLHDKPQLSLFFSLGDPVEMFPLSPAGMPPHTHTRTPLGSAAQTRACLTINKLKNLSQLHVIPALWNKAINFPGQKLRVQGQPC